MNIDDIIGSGGTEEGIRVLLSKAGAEVVASVYLMGVKAEGYEQKRLPNLYVMSLI